ncbi:Transcription factor MYC/MYB N-terminal [Macleaya cordata]|uniref:Transcription factor MYC/MYB N-terminal n=1 Tax=Macleaya cordata TaxID=56857 RepID=A0A200R0U0_MACCD|nr:Transcription factor MYC/MYB N-terminal [Macleaya cordata]
MEEYINPLAVTHLLQHTLRSLCIHENSQWVYAVFWRILPRNYPPPKWDVQGGAYDRSRGNRRNWYWILVWEDGFCNFGASMAEIDSSECMDSSMIYGNGEFQHLKGLQPELFFKMSHEIYNYGEGLIGKVAADHSHKWVHKERSEQELNFMSTWHNPGDSHPRTWEAQFQSGLKTIALIAVREGVVQLGSHHKVTEDLNYIVMLQKKFSYLQSIPGVLLPHPSSNAVPFKVDRCIAPETWSIHSTTPTPPPTIEFYNHQFTLPVKNITPSMSSLEALLSKLPSVVPTPSFYSSGYHESSPQFVPLQRPSEFMETMKLAKEEISDYGHEQNSSSGSMSYYQNQHPHLN